MHPWWWPVTAVAGHGGEAAAAAARAVATGHRRGDKRTASGGAGLAGPCPFNRFTDHDSSSQFPKIVKRKVSLERNS